MTDPFFSRQGRSKSRPFSPTLPDSFVPRPDQLNPLKRLLTEPSTSRTLVLSSKNGLGGMGKTSLALALTQDDVVKATFPDGVLWATLGPEPDLLTPMGQWLSVLDDQGMERPTLPMASAQLRHLVKRRRMLLVVDEVWSIEDLQPFQVVEDTACLLLITTRDVVVPDAPSYILGEMTASQAQQLFEIQLKQSLEHRNRKDALQFAKTVGYLPLSLHLGVSQIKNGLSWSELMTGILPHTGSSTVDSSTTSDADGEPLRPRWERSLTTFQNLWNPNRTKDLQHQARQACFTFCLRRLPPELRFRLASLSLFPRNIDITPRMAGTVWGLSISVSRHHLQDLKHRGFLTHGDMDAEQGQSYSLHPVMRDIAQWLIQLPRQSELQGLGMTWATAHQQLLERYRPQLQANQWNTIPDDGYIHSHLIWHLEQAGWQGEIHQLLQAFNEKGHNAWYDVCRELKSTTGDRIGRQSNFTVDIARAWQLATQIYGEAPEHSTGLQVRYALTSAFMREHQHPIQSIEHIGPDDLQNQPQDSRLSSEHWAFTKVLLNAARYLPDLGAKIINSTLLPSTLNSHLKEQTLVELLQNVHQESAEMAVELTESLLPNPESIDALIRLVPNHPSLSLPLWQALQNASDDQRLVQGAACLASADLHHLYPDLFTLLPKLQHPLDRLLILAQIETRLPDVLRKKARALKQDCLNELSARREGRGQLPLTFSNSMEPCNEATQDFLELYRYSGWAIALCFEQYPSRRLDEAYSQVIRSRSEEKRSKALAFLIPRLSEKHRREIWTLAQQLSDPECKTRVLVRLHPFRPKALKTLMEVAKLFENKKKLNILIDSLPGSSALIESILSTIRALGQPQERWPYLIQILPYLSKDHYGDLVTIIQESPFDSAGITTLLSHLNPDQLLIAKGILAKVDSIPPVYERATALEQIVPHLPPSLTNEALEIAQQIQFPYARVIALQNFIPDYPEIAQDTIEALESCHQDSPNDVYDDLIPLLPPAEREDAIALIAMIPDEVSQLKRLIRTLPYEPKLIDQIKHLVTQNPNLHEHCDMQNVLSELSTICDADLLSSTPTEPCTLDLMVAMLPLIDWVYGSSELGTDTFNFCEQVQAFLAHPSSPQFDITALSNLLDFFYLIPREEKRAETLEKMFQAVTDLETITPEHWMEWLEKLSRYQPAEFEWVFSSMVRFLMGFSNNNTLNQVLQSIRSVREQWL